MPLKLNSNIDQLKKNLEEISNTNQLRFDELFNTEFLSEHTSFTSLDDMFENQVLKSNQQMISR